MMRERSFVAFILTHGRAGRVHTYESLRKHGYTGPIVVVVDDEDRTAAEYLSKFGSEVYIFDKKAIAKRIDEGDNFGDRRAIIYARNACFDIAREMGFRYFVQLDDDYVDFRHKRNARGDFIHKKGIADLDAVFDAMLDFFKAAPQMMSIAMAQGGDFIGGADGSWEKPRRKCMNSFICSTDRPFEFFGRINEDVNTYTNLAARGGLFLTTTAVALQQKQTQTNAGGMSDLYVDSGTYVKSFYSVMYQPSSVKVSVMQSTHARIHHKVKWRNTTPQIVREMFRHAR
jgi:hypothetical protein